MKKKTLTVAITAAGFVAALFIYTTPLRAEHNHGAMVAAQASPSASGTGPLVEEMRRLDNVFRDIVSAVSLGDGEKVHSAIEGMHGAKEKTQEALHKGAVKPPKNADKTAQFERMDNDFHKKLESLAVAAHKNDRKRMLSLTKELMDGCVNCHTVFRK